MQAKVRDAVNIWHYKFKNMKEIQIKEKCYFSTIIWQIAAYWSEYASKKVSSLQDYMFWINGASSAQRTEKNIVYGLAVALALPFQTMSEFFFFLFVASLIREGSQIKKTTKVWTYFQTVGR